MKLIVIIVTVGVFEMIPRGQEERLGEQVIETAVLLTLAWILKRIQEILLD